MPVSWAEGLEPEATPSVPIMTVRGKTIARFLGDVQTVLTHYLPGQGTRPCLGEKCRHCENDLPTIRAGYAPTEIYRRSDDPNQPSWILRVLPIASGNLLELSRSVTGKVFEIDVVMSGCVKRFQYQERVAMSPPVHSWFDVRPILERHWFPNRRVDQVENSSPVQDCSDAPAILQFRRKAGAA